MRWPSSLAGFAAVVSQAACTVFQNDAAVRSACANAGCATRPIAATMAQTAARMTPPWQNKGTLEYSLVRGRRAGDRGRGPLLINRPGRGSGAVAVDTLLQQRKRALGLDRDR